MLILASTSKYRRALLQRLGVPFDCVPPRIDEDTFEPGDLVPGELAAALARAKAESVAAEHPRATVIGSDQVCSLGGEVLGKPLTETRAVEQLARLSGKAHELLTAVCVIHPEGRSEHVDCARLHMCALDRGQIERYVALDQPLDCAGSYKLERAGVALFERIECEDHSAITGLPLMVLAQTLRGLGYRLP